MTPPLEKRIFVDCDVEHAFAVFTERIDVWWPGGHRRVRGSVLHLEPFVGGRFFERAPNGEEFDMGTVRAWEAPRRICYSWRPGCPDAPTEVEVRFLPENAGTRVHVIHRIGATGNDAAFGNAVPRFEAGWAVVLAAYFGACSPSATS